MYISRIQRQQELQNRNLSLFGQKTYDSNYKHKEQV